MSYNMLTLNLVSAEQKKEIKLRHLYDLIKKINLILVIIAIAIAIILLVAKIILQIKFNEVVEQTTLVTKNNQGYNSRVREINSQLNYIEKIQNGYIPWSKLIKKLSEMAPADVSFQYLKINYENKSVNIKGQAKTRDSLINFKDKMAADETFKNIEFPIKNILEKENIDFEISAELNLSKI